jgi:hypothetical protein
MVADAPDGRPGGEYERDEEEAASGVQEIRLHRVAGHCGGLGTAAGGIGERSDGPSGHASDRCGGEAREENSPAPLGAAGSPAAPPQ